MAGGNCCSIQPSTGRKIRFCMFELSRVVPRIELNIEAGRDAAYTAALNVLAAAKEHLGSLDKVTRVVRLGVFIATFGDFFDQPKVADAVSDLFRDVFGIQKTSVRVVIGGASLPLGLPVGLDVIFEVAE